MHLPFSPVYKITDAATAQLVASVNAANNTLWNKFKAKNKKQLNAIIEPLNGGGGAIVPNNGGVYIWGFWIECNGKKYLVPLYVGMSKTDCVKHILNNHLKANGGEYSCFGTKALVNYPNCTNVTEMYQCLQEYNNFLIGAAAAYIGILMGGFWATPHSNWLAFFHNRAFYVNKIPHCNACGITGYHDIYNHDQNHALYNLLHIPVGCGNGVHLADEIKKARIDLAKHFCFTYMDLKTAANSVSVEHDLYNDAQEYLNNGVYNIGGADGPGRSLNRKFERGVKKALEDLGIYTFSEAGGALPHPATVDFSASQDELINIGGHRYGNPYINPLHIHV
ncbi:MAG: hypothetical protein EBX41_02645 [Chitinophagia bacterium]|nr:hypothetical protein [Chitinophagia bacterium]